MKVDEEVVDEVVQSREVANGDKKSSLEKESDENDEKFEEKLEDELAKTVEKPSPSVDKGELGQEVKTDSKKTADEYLVEIEDLKKSNETLLSENQALKSELSAKDAQFSKSLEEMQINNAVEISIREANGKNIKAIKALINFDEVSLDSSGEVVGLDEQIELLKTSESSSFLFDENELILKGVTPVSSAKASGISVADFQKMSYKERLELYNKDASLYKTLKY